ncbi:hypothetical protein UlMin_002140 [Ulmus minor]
MAEKDHAWPLAPANTQTRSDVVSNEALTAPPKCRHKNYAKCCGLLTAVFLIVVVTMIVLAFTVFHVSGPTVKMNGVTIERLEFANGTLRTDVNITLVADVSVKNPNAASFRFGNTTTDIYYGGASVGEGRNPAGIARARRTMRMNMTVDIVPAKILAFPGLMREIAGGTLTMKSYTKIEGRVKIINIVKKHVVVRLNCTMTYNTGKGEIERQDCRRRVSL